MTTRATREVPFTRLFAAVAACVGAVTEDELLRPDEEPLLTAAYLIAEHCGVRLDHRHDRESAVRSLVHALRQAGMDWSVQGEGRTLTLVTETGERVPLALTQKDVEKTLLQLVSRVPREVAQVFALTPSDTTDTHLFAVVPSSKVVVMNAALGAELPALVRELGKRPRKPLDARVANLPAPKLSEPKRSAAVRELHRNWRVASNRVYFLGKAVRGIDPSTVRLLHPDFVRDDHRVFYGSTPLEVDANTFEIFEEQGAIRGECWARDRKSVYFFEDLDAAPKELDADPASFRVLGEHATDGKKVWASGRLLRSAKAETWKRLAGRHWSTDGRRVFFFAHTLPKADASSFEPVLEYWAFDRNTVFERMKAVSAEAASAAASNTFAFIGETRVVARAAGSNETQEKFTLSTRCERWLRRPPRLDNTPDVGELQEDTWFLMTRTLPENLEGPRILVVMPSVLNKEYSIVAPGPAWEHQVLDRLAVMERWLALAR